MRELLSASQFIQVGEAMENCLRTQRGVYKYSDRARSKSSSFWIVCYRDVARKDDLECVLVFEVWNESKIVHQAEGPGSRFPSSASLRHMQTWAEGNDVVWNTWEMW